MKILTNIEVGDNYPISQDAGLPIIEDLFGSKGGYANIQNADVMCKLQYEHYGSEVWTEEFHLAQGTVSLGPGVLGIQFRNFTPGVPATIDAVLSFPNEPVLVLGSGGQAISNIQGIPVFNVMAPAYGAKGDGVTDDTSAIQSAINAAEATKYGGIIWLPPGLYMISAPLSITSSNISMWGSGAGNQTTPYGTSVIRTLPGFAGAMMLNVRSTTPTVNSIDNVTLRDFVLDGFGAGSPFSNTDGIYWGVFRGRIQNVDVWRVQQTALVVDGGGSFVFPLGAWDNLIVNCNFGNFGGNGIWFTGQSSDNTVEACIIGNGGGNNIQIDASCPGERILNCYLQTATGYQIFANDCGECMFIGNRMRESNGGIFIGQTVASGRACIISGNTLKNCSEAADGATDGIHIAPATSLEGLEIGPNSFAANHANRMGSAINVVNANAKDISIANQSYSFEAPAASCYSVCAVRDSGTNTRIEGITLARNAVGSSHTGDLIETTLATVVVRGGLIGFNGKLRITTMWSMTNDANNKTLKTKFGTQIYGDLVQASIATYRQQVEISNVNAQNVQKAMPAGTGYSGFGSSAAIPLAGADDTSQDQNIVITGQLANAADTVTLESYLVELMPG